MKFFRVVVDGVNPDAERVGDLFHRGALHQFQQHLLEARRKLGVGGRPRHQAVSWM